MKNLQCLFVAGFIFASCERPTLYVSCISPSSCRAPWCSPAGRFCQEVDCECRPPVRTPGLCDPVHPRWLLPSPHMRMPRPPRPHSPPMNPELSPPSLPPGLRRRLPSKICAGGATPGARWSPSMSKAPTPTSPADRRWPSSMYPARRSPYTWETSGWSAQFSISTRTGGLPVCGAIRRTASIRCGDPSHPVEAGLYVVQARALVAAGDRAWVAGPEGLSVFDISDPPILVPLRRYHMDLSAGKLRVRATVPISCPRGPCPSWTCAIFWHQTRGRLYPRRRHDRLRRGGRPAVRRAMAGRGRPGRD